MNGCVWQNEEGRCLKFTDEVYQSWCVGDGEKCEFRNPSHGDGIRAMTDEEIADFIGPRDCLGCPLDNPTTFCDVREGETCHDALLRWLKEGSKT